MWRDSKTYTKPIDGIVKRLMNMLRTRIYIVFVEAKAMKLRTINAATNASMIANEAINPKKYR